jgi:MAF protein
LEGQLQARWPSSLSVTRFLLASQSPRRRQLLALVGYPFQVMAANVNEEIVDHPDPSENSLLTASLKARTVLDRLPRKDSERAIIVAADTTVALDGQMLGKPAGTADAVRMLQDLRGREHQVHTGMSLIDRESGQEATAVHIAHVTMRAYSDSEIEAYVASGDPLDKAGAYAIQHPQFKPVESLNGCYLGVMGLSVCQLLQLLRELGVPELTDPVSLAEAHGHYACPLL